MKTIFQEFAWTERSFHIETSFFVKIVWEFCLTLEQIYKFSLYRKKGHGYFKKLWLFNYILEEDYTEKHFNKNSEKN